MSELRILVSFDHVCWDAIRQEMDDYGRIKIGDDAIIQVLPITEMNFLPTSEKVIEMLMSVGSQIAIGLFVNWLYDKMKMLGKNQVIINKQVVEITTKQSVEATINIILHHE